MYAAPKLFTALSAAVLASASLVFHESRPAPPVGYVSQGSTQADQTLELRIGLVSNNLSGLQDKLASISTPGSADFRQWLSADAVKSFVQPSAATLAAFSSFAEANNLKTTSVSPHGDWVSITTTAGQANSLFGAHFQDFVRQGSSQPLVRTLSVSLPSELVGHVEVVHPTTSFDDSDPRLTSFSSQLTRRSTARRDIPSSCNSTITPTCLIDLYGIPTTPATEKSSTLLVTGYDNQFAELEDVSQFLSIYRTDIDPSTTFALEAVDNGRNPQDPDSGGSEADLDVEYTVGLATGVPVAFLSNGNLQDFPTALVDSANYIANMTSLPTVITTSYGLNEDTFSPSLATKLCNTYSAITAQGVSLIYASGDGGVRGSHDKAAQCSNNTFIATFPASCPFVTSVGSTFGIQPERAINFSAGGFSNLFALPDYQATAVAYFKKTLPSDFAGVFNQTGRGYPDVSTQGSNFEYIIGPEHDVTSGTSASAPTFASIIALINDRLVAAGKPVLGFLNPWIYSTAESAFTDITIGKNVGGSCPDTAVGFSAVAGWDPASGVGTPNFQKLLDAAMT